MCTDLAFTLILSFRLRGTIYESLEIPKGLKSYLPINDENDGFVDFPTNSIDESTRYRRYRSFLVETERCVSGKLERNAATIVLLSRTRCSMIRSELYARRRSTTHYVRYLLVSPPTRLLAILVPARYEKRSYVNGASSSRFESVRVGILL